MGFSPWKSIGFGQAQVGSMGDGTSGGPFSRGFGMSSKKSNKWGLHQAN